jgi:hypothetical protein
LGGASDDDDFVLEAIGHWSILEEFNTKKKKITQRRRVR